MVGDTGQITVLLIPEDGQVASDAWQSECEKLARVMASYVSDGDVRVRPETASALPGSSEHARGLLATFSTLVISGLRSDNATSAVGHVWDALTEWMKRRRGCRCVIKLADGSEFYFENLAKEEALKLLEARTRPKRASALDKK